MIELSSELLARVMPSEEKRARKLVADLRAASDRMSALVRDLLDVAAIEAGHFTIDRQPVEAAALVDEVAASARTLAEAKSQSLITTMARRDLVVRCDRRRVAQVLINLVDNAVKYSPDGTTITLTVDGDAAGVRFAVADAGPGIPAADARKVFDPFWRRSDSAKRGNSTGLGLTVAKTIVEAHGGRIWAARNDDRGLTLHVQLPVDRT